MPVIKEFESREADIQCLEALIAEHGDKPSIKKQLDLELRKIRMGDKAEKNAGYLLGSIYRERKDAYLINGLRLEIEGDVAQIDHMTLNSYGVVFLFETKTFSTGIKIDDDGTFWRWDGYNKTYIEIPSPLEQSKRHERVVRRALEKIGYQPEMIKHFVVVDYKAKLIKPKKGFETVCRPDRVEKAINESLQIGDTFKFVKLIGKMISGKKLNPLQIKVFARKLVDLNTPIEFNYRAKFGLGSKNIEPITHKVTEPTAVYEIKKKAVLAQENPIKESPTKTKPNKLTLSKLAKSMNLKTTALESMLIDQGYLERREKGVYLSQKGKEFGFEVRKGRFGFYFLIPSEFSFKVA